MNFSRQHGTPRHSTKCGDNFAVDLEILIDYQDPQFKEVARYAAS